MNAQIQRESAIAKAQAETAGASEKSKLEIERLQVEFMLKEEFEKKQHERKMKELELQGRMKAEHIKIAQDDIEADMTKIRKQ